jgi:hypothetical protein
MKTPSPCAKQYCNSVAAVLPALLLHHAKECGMQYCSSAAKMLRAARHEWHMGMLYRIIYPLKCKDWGKLFVFRVSQQQIN